MSGFNWKALPPGPKKPPANAISTPEYMKHFGYNQATAFVKLTAAVNAGQLETGLFVTNGHRRRFYWAPKRAKRRVKKT